MVPLDRELRIVLQTVFSKKPRLTRLVCPRAAVWALDLMEYSAGLTWRSHGCGPLELPKLWLWAVSGLALLATIAYCRTMSTKPNPTEWLLAAPALSTLAGYVFILLCSYFLTGAMAGDIVTSILRDSPSERNPAPRGRHRIWSPRHCRARWRVPS